MSLLIGLGLVVQAILNESRAALLGGMVGFFTRDS